MKKFLVLLLAFGLILSFAACEITDEETTVASTEKNTEEATTEEPTEGEETTAPATDAMSYEEFIAAEIDAEVVVEAYVQATQVYSEQYGNTSIYLQDEDGAYFVYRYACTAEEYAKLTAGTKVRVEGIKAEWSGELEITEATVTVLDGTYTAPVTDVTDLLANAEELIKHQNKFAAFKNLTVVASKDAEGNDVAFLYKYNGSGEDGDDLYFNVSDGVNVYNFTVETDLCDKDSAVYAAVKALKIGDVINAEGFLYWYNGANPHITKVEASNVTAKSEDAMTYDEYVAAAVDADVIVEAFVRGVQKYAESYGNTSIYLQDEAGAYFVYRYACTAEEYAKLTVGTKVRVEGVKAEWSGELEVTDATLTILDGKYVAPVTDVTAILANADELVKHQNKFVSFTGLTVAASKDANGNDVAFLYKYNGSGEDGDDLYFNVTDGTNTYSFTVETDLCAADSAVYAAVKALKVGDKIDAEGFLYWYNGVNPHITSVKVVAE